MDWDLLIHHGTIIDGTGRSAFPGHIGIKNGRINAITGSHDSLPPDMAAESVDASGLVVSPGFIDAHSHSDFLLARPDHAELAVCLPEQGVTTVVGGNCGFSPSAYGANALGRMTLDTGAELLCGEKLPYQWGSMASFLESLEQNGMMVNLAQLEGHGTLRSAMLGEDYTPPDAAALKRLENFVAGSIEAGAIGLSFGLGYAPGMFAGAEELDHLARVVKRFGGILTVHLKALSRISPAYGVNPFGEPHNIRSLKETTALAERTGVRLQISHLIFVGKRTWPSCEAAIGLVEDAKKRGVDIAFDSFPQTAGNTTVYALYPDWFLKDVEKNFSSPLARLRLAAEWTAGFHLVGFSLDDVQILWGGHPDLEKYNGRFMPEIAGDMKRSPMSAFIRITRRSEGRATCLIHRYSGDASDRRPLDAVLTHPLNLFMTDAIVSPRGSANPGAYGTFPRVIDDLYKKKARLSLETIIAMMTGRTAERFGLKGRGVLAPGNHADITLFDPAEIRDNTTPENSRAKPSGIRHVFINGRQVVRNGDADAGIRAGCVIRKTSA